MHTVIFSHDGITRTYKCDSYFDALILADAFRSRYYCNNITASVQIWEGMTQVS